MFEISHNLSGLGTVIGTDSLGTLGRLGTNIAWTVPGLKCLEQPNLKLLESKI